MANRDYERKYGFNISGLMQPQMNFGTMMGAESTQVQPIGNIQPLGSGSDPRGNAQMQSQSALTEPPASQPTVTQPPAPQPTMPQPVTPTMSDEIKYIRGSNPGLRSVNSAPTNSALSTQQLPTDTRFLEPMEVSTMDKMKAGYGNLSGTQKAMGALQIGSSLASGIQNIQQRGRNVDNLRDSVSSMESAINNLAEQKSSGIESLQQQFSENRRRIGARGNLRLNQALSNIRPRSNITSGTVTQLKEDVTDAFGTQNDLAIADAYDRSIDEQSAFEQGIDNQRRSMTSQLDQLKQQLKDEENANRWAPVNMVLDTAIAGVGMVNPVAGAGLSALKRGVMDPYTT